jgi:hypothetical protein
MIVGSCDKYKMVLEKTWNSLKFNSREFVAIRDANIQRFTNRTIFLRLETRLNMLIFDDDVIITTASQRNHRFPKL